MLDAEQIARGFGLEPVRRMVRVAEGEMAYVWRLDTDAASYAVKEPRWYVDPDAARPQLEFSTLVSDAARRAGIVAPQDLRTTSGALQLAVTDEDRNETAYIRLATWIDGRPCDPATDASPAAAWLGTTLATLEQLPDPQPIPAPDQWLLSWFTTVPSEDQWLHALDDARREHASWAELLASQVPRLVELGRVVTPPPPDELTVTHTDLQAKNVLVTKTGFALLDWDDAAPFSRVRVLARALVEWHTHTGFDAAAISRTMLAYRSAGGTATINSTTDFAYVAASFLNYLYEQITSRNPENRIVGLLQRPLELATIDRVIDVVHEL